MRYQRFTIPARTIATLLASVLLAILAVPLAAPAAGDSTSHYPLVYDKTQEITLTGTIQQIVSHPAAGEPFGLQLLIAGPQGTVAAHLGPYISHDTQQALQIGTPVQIVGAMATYHGKDYLLARQLIFSGRLVTVRSENGFLLQGQGSHTAHHSSAKTSQTEANGGAQ